MKFKILSKDDLSHLEEELKHFLIANGVSNEEWISMNENNPDKAIDLVELFSDVVYQKVFEQLKFVEHQSTSALLVFKCDKEEIQLIGINVKPGMEGDLSTPDNIQNTMTKHQDSLEIFRSTKPYTKEREIEVFEMVESGCVNSHEAFWMQLEKLFK
jgi:hypothetical protein